MALAEYTSQPHKFNHFNKNGLFGRDRQVPQQLLLEFLRSQKLIPDANEYYRFLRIMNRLHYIDFPELSPVEEFSDSYRGKLLLVSPAQVFRYQDMYIELRGLDYFSERRSTLDRHVRRLELRKNAEKFEMQRR